jgi:dTDP-4-amino-4,6-dideoxygalactose transaminase
MDAIMAIALERGLKVIEDCAQATGATYKGRRVGSIGDVGCFSFFPTKNLGALGDGGMITTSDSTLAERVRGLRQYGWADEHSSIEPGVNSRLDELQAAILSAKLVFLDEDNQRRRTIADDYSTNLKGLAADTGLVLPRRHPDRGHVFHLYVVRTPDRDALRTHLRDHGIAAAIHYAEPVHRQPAYQGLGGTQTLDETDKAAAEVLTLPIYPELEKQTLEKIFRALESFNAPK